MLSDLIEIIIIAIMMMIICLKLSLPISFEFPACLSLH